MKWFPVFRWLLVAGCHRLPHLEWEAAVPGRSPGAKLLRGLWRHLPLPGQKHCISVCTWTPILILSSSFSILSSLKSLNQTRKATCINLNAIFANRNMKVIQVFKVWRWLLTLDPFSSGVMATGSTWSSTTASQPSTTSWSSLSRLRGTSSGAPCWRRLTPSEYWTVLSWYEGLWCFILWMFGCRTGLSYS